MGMAVAFLREVLANLRTKRKRKVNLFSLSKEGKLTKCGQPRRLSPNFKFALTIT